ncbi:MAG: type 1 glutamine amidotransferase [Burkholderiales bacterium]
MKRRRLLYLQNGTKRQPVSDFDERFAAAGFEVDIHWAYGGEFPQSLDPYHAVFLSGSPHGAYETIPFITREHELIVAMAERALPTLGVCFGSQILASALCGRDQIFRRESCEVGYKWLDPTPIARSDELMCDLGDRVYMFVWHNDEIRAKHPDMRILATSNLCPNQIWRYRDLPMWGVQGHPEISHSQSRIWFEENRARLEADGADVDLLHAAADEAEGATTLIDNFISISRKA